MLLQMPAFFVLYSVIRGITNTVTIPAHTVTVAGFKKIVPEQVKAIPRYIPNPSKMRTDIVAAHGKLNAFGIDFAQKLLSHHSSLWVAIPYLVLVAGAVGLQYLQMSRLNARNPQASQANPQAAMMQKYMPLIFGFIYLNVAAILNVYFIVSSGIRILTQEILFRRGIVAGPPATATGPSAATKKGPAADRTERALPKPKANPSQQKAASGTNGSGSAGTNGKAGSNGKGGANPAKTASSNGNGSAQGNRKAPVKGSNGSKGPGSSGGSRSQPKEGAGQPQPKEHPRSKAKRERRAR
jgi:hypothetical protein